MSNNSNIVLTSCHSGGGASLDKSENKLQALANSSGANVYGNMSWGSASVDRFSNSEYSLGMISYAAVNKIPKAHKGSTDVSNAINNLGKWKVASPNKNFTNIVNKLFFTKNGGFKNE